MVPQGARSALKHVFMYWLLKLLSKSVVWWLRSQTFTEKCNFFENVDFRHFCQFSRKCSESFRNRPWSFQTSLKDLRRPQGRLEDRFFCRFEENAKNDEKSYLSIQSTSFFSPRRVLRTLPPAAYDGGVTSFSKNNR